MTKIGKNMPKMTKNCQNLPEMDKNGSKQAKISQNRQKMFKNRPEKGPIWPFLVIIGHFFQKIAIFAQNIHFQAF